MKLFVTVCLTFSVFACFAQDAQRGMQVGQSLVLQNMQDARANALGNNALIEGSPYFEDVFNLSKVEGIDKVFLSKYNIALDQFELKEDENVYILPKKPEYKTIILGKSKYVLLEYNADNVLKTGYLVELFKSDNVALYKKMRIKTTEKQEAKGYDKATPARYVKISPEFYIKIKENTTDYFPKNKKELISLFPDSKEKIEGFLKENKTSFKNETDLIKLTEFLAQL